ncbi:MAG: RNA polymerase sigma factor [Chromatocurvus sp.]
MKTASLKKLKSGDRESFAEVVRNNHRALISLAVPIVGQSEAEEVVQNAWLKAHAAIKDFEGRAQLRTWLGRIVINEAKMLLRKRKKELLFSDWQTDDQTGDVLAERFSSSGSWQSPPSQWDLDTPQDLLMREDLATCLEQLLDAMPANQRAVLELRDTAGVSFEEICNELTVSASNARVTLHRARTQVYKLVEHYEETGEC